jgi:hypothetical protein
MLPGPQSRRRNGCLTAALRSNLIEIAQTKRFGDAEALLDVLLDRLTPAKLSRGILRAASLVQQRDLRGQTAQPRFETR